MNIAISKNNSEQVGVVFDRIMGPSDPELFVDQVGILSTAKETIRLSGPFVPPDWFSFWNGNYGWFCSMLKTILASSTSKFEHWNTTCRWRRSQFIHWIKQLHFFDPLHCFRRKLWTSTNLGLESYLPASKKLQTLGTRQNEAPKSAIIVGLLHNSLKNLLHWRWVNLWMTIQTSISDLDFVLAFHVSPL